MPPSRALLVGILVPGRPPEDLDASLDELGRLCKTLGFQVVGRFVQRRADTEAAQLLGRGRLKALADWTGGSGEVHRGPKKTKKNPEDDEIQSEMDEDDWDLPSDEDEDADLDDAPEPPEDDAGPGPDGPRANVVVVDHDLSPSQLRNLKDAAGCEVLDRSGVIIEIFSQRARSREARLQVELARLTYLAPRRRELGGPSERPRGGIGGKGAGETGVELDRRRNRDRMAEIRRELAELEGNSAVRRERRQDARKVALVGYTNAGKSSLMRALTDAEPYVADQLFATLDTTIRRLHPAARPPILVTDTVGFIKDLPHSLVASFRSTLDAAAEASLLLHVVDASDPTWRQQEEVTAAVLGEIGAADIARVLLFNKCDRLSEDAIAALQAERPDAWTTSARSEAATAALHARIVSWFVSRDPEAELFVPWSHASVTGMIHAQTTVMSEVFEDEGVRFQVRAAEDVLARVRGALGITSAG